MTDDASGSPAGDNEAPIPEPPSPIHSENEAVLRDAKEKPADKNINVTVNIPTELRPIELLQLFINGALAVIGVIAICIYGKQLTAMKGQLDQLIRQYPELQKSADAADRASHTADDTLKETKKNFRSDERPYVIIDGTPTFVSTWQKTTADANIAFRNVGHTPALEELTFAILRQVSFAPGHTTEKELASDIDEIFADIAKDEDKAETPIGRYAAREDIAPQATAPFFTKKLPKPTSDYDVYKIRTGNDILVYAGVLQYKGFEGTERYETQFCFYFFGDDPRIWHYCPIHNTVR